MFRGRVDMQRQIGKRQIRALEYLKVRGKYPGSGWIITSDRITRLILDQLVVRKLAELRDGHYQITEAGRTELHVFE